VSPDEQSAPNQDREKQERLLALVGWLSIRHERGTRGHGGLQEFCFRREGLAGLDILDQYAPAHDPGAARKLHRDVADLADFGIDLHFEPITDEWVSRAAPFNDRERRALAIAALSVAVRDPASPGRWHLPGAGITSQAAVLILSQGHLVDILLDAVRAKRRVRLVHRKVPREVAPLGLTEVRGRWYLVAQDLERGERRVFGLDSVESAEPYGEAKAFDFGRADLETAVEEVLDPDRWVDAEPVIVRLRVDQRLTERACRLLRAQECGPADAAGWVPLECTVRNRDAFLNRLFALRSRAVVEGPPEIRSLVMDRLRATAEATR
jgi:predicted DNA-binding transcriptional regulator YafY